jgi:ubiquinone/menaquinone biosynthesis C-methylase UbiE
LSNNSAEYGERDGGPGRLANPISRIPGYGEQLPALYELDRSNGWSIGMRSVTHALVIQANPPPGPILELGCGAGVFNAELAKQRADRGPVWGVDLHPLALAYARKNIADSGMPQPPAILQANLHNLPVPDATLSAVLALDVFDQKDVQIEAALAESRRVLRTGGKLILRVSAYPWLEGRHDAAFNTGRRYYRREIAAVLAAQRFQIERLTHANTLLAAPVILLRFLQRWGLLAVDGTVYHDTVANQLFVQALRLEAGWLVLCDLPFGISLYAIASKVTA